ncbi:MAG: prolyl oligopeptidase family serine peptidase [Bacteroidia bacterium]|nr:prolyl oligopeptidase family serine peptidase [Bacteroidia bacterium]
MKQILIFPFLLLGCIAATQAQKKILGHEELVTWNRINDRQISNDGEFVMYRLTKETGDPILNVYSAQSGETWTYTRASKPAFTHDSRFVIFHISASQDSIKALKRAKKKKKDMPQDSLGILDLNSMTLLKIPDVKNYSVPEKWSGWMAYQLEPLIVSKNNESRDMKNDDEKKIKKESAKNGSKLIIRNLTNANQDTITYVKSYTIAKEGKRLAFHTTGIDSTQTEGIYAIDLSNDNQISVFQAKGEFQNMTWNRTGDHFSFIANLDTTDALVPPFELYTWSLQSKGIAIQVNTSSIRGMDWIIQPKTSLDYSKNGQRLFFGIAPLPVIQDTSLLDEEIVNVEVWNYKDGRIYTQQESQQRRDKEKGFRCMMNISDGSIRQVETTEHPNSASTRDRNERHMILYDDRPYQQMTTWESFSLRDLFILDTQTGSINSIAKGINGFTRLSPTGKFAYWYSQPDTSWYAYEVETRQLRQLTDNDLGPFYDEINDRPRHPSPAGSAGWNEDESTFFIYDRYDIWAFDPRKQKSPKRLTKGRETSTRYRYQNLDRDNQHIDTETPGMVHIFNYDSKESGWGKINWSNGNINILEYGPHNYRNILSKAKNSTALIMTREDFNSFPDLILTDTNFENQKRISDVNPQQSEYNWGNIEMVEWVSLDGIPLKGMLVKPENFDPSKKYPMIVNFYEKSSDGLYRHRPPSAGRSTINYPFYASRGYIIFNPDIPYKVGYPGESAYNAVMPGITQLIASGYIDENNIALQGHSWGGYQIAYMITRTDMFKCVESGAPVVNMFSAYGGIRWGSGRSRMFQYERTQSRIGGTIWEYPIRYLENSPIFTIDKIKTPVLIMHNDKDTAVPWYQGIEFFGALRRLGKPAWMLNYNDEPHWPVKKQNRIDFNIRMQQFFDHYLKGAPIPVWMDKGVSPINKGINQGLELNTSQK